MGSQVELTDHVKQTKKSNNMGRVRTKTVKKASRRIIEKYYTRLGLDFYTNSRIVSEVAIVPTKHLSNQIAGFITHTMKRIQKGPVRGISIKPQEEERERRDNYVPEQSALCEPLELDDTTTEMLKENENDEITTFQNSPLSANHWNSMTPPPRC